MFRFLRIAMTKDAARMSLAYAEVGRDYFARNNLRKASQAFMLGWQAALSIDETNPLRVWFAAFHATNQGLIDGIQRDYDSAESWCRRALKYNPSFAKAHELKAKILVAEGDLQEADKEMDLALSLNASAKEPDPTVISGIRILQEQLRLAPGK